MSDSRKIATEILKKIFRNKNFETSIIETRDFEKLDPRDKSFVRLIVLETLRHNGQIDFIISKFLKKPMRSKNSFIENLLRISISQILYLNIAEYSVVNSAVEISKKYNLSKFVNALLRNVCREKEDLQKKIPEEKNIPDWIKKDIIDFFGTKILEDISKTITKEPYLDIKIKSQSYSERKWGDLLGGFEILKETLRIKNQGNITELPFFYEGDWWIQGVSASIPVRIINKIFKKNIRKNINILDVCAAPGGKSFQLLESGYNVISLDKSPLRIKKLKENLKRLNFNSKIICDDINTYESNFLYDCILIDAPCTASGLIQKKPDILIRDKSPDLKKITENQLKILLSCSQKIKKDGYLVYTVCSMLQVEGIKLIKKFLKNNDNFDLVKIEDDFKNVAQIYKDVYVISIPANLKKFGGVDGFFTVCLKRIKK